MTSPHSALHPPRRRLALALALLFSVVVGLLGHAPAAAVTGTGLGPGHLWRGDNASWLGTYRLDDGTQAFCLEAGKSSPVGNHYDTTTVGDVIGVSTDGHARLAYIVRTWGGTTDADTAAAGQLAVWTITGLNGHTQRYYAGRANERWPIVLERANQMLAEASSAASKSVAASITVELSDDGTGLIRPDLTVDRVTGGPTALEPTHAGTVTLDGAVFEDGSTTALVRNGESVPVTATGDAAQLIVNASVEFVDLPYGRVTTVGNSPAGSQMILFSGGVAASASEAASVEQLSPLPFRPSVSTVTSDSLAEAGTIVTDQVTLGVRPGDGLLVAPQRIAKGVGCNGNIILIAEEVDSGALAAGHGQSVNDFNVRRFESTPRLDDGARRGLTTAHYEHPVGGRINVTDAVELAAAAEARTASGLDAAVRSGASIWGFVDSRTARRLFNGFVCAAVIRRTP
ncbi:thioester domain-containing protein [Frigoribacterium sp. R86507]|uniref:thioester domain-containing protein n=1 Tax=Frigoribacterium sp. R86507 TaxID=3093850 RepID=UPI0037CC621D